jgi:L-ascorbate metabolism protein UlaG (beta-lactamase superfamily)
MVITYLGNGHIRVQSGEKVLVVDPTSTRAKSDVTLRTSYDIDQAHPADEIVCPGEYEIGGIEIVGSALADAQKEKITTAYVVTWEDVRLMFLEGLKDATAALPEELSTEVDVLFIAGGEKETLSADDATRLIRQIQPSVVVPVYQKSVEELAKKMGATVDLQEKFVFKKKELVPQEMKMIIIEAKG